VAAERPARGADPQLVNGARSPPTGAVSAAQLRQILAGYATKPGSPRATPGSRPPPHRKRSVRTVIRPVPSTSGTSQTRGVGERLPRRFATSAGAVANIADGDVTTTWASANSPVLARHRHAHLRRSPPDRRGLGGGGVRPEPGPTSSTSRPGTARLVTQGVRRGARVASEQRESGVAADSAALDSDDHRSPAGRARGEPHLEPRRRSEIRPTFGAAASSGLGVLSGRRPAAWPTATRRPPGRRRTPRPARALQLDPGAPQTVTSLDLGVRLRPRPGPDVGQRGGNPGGVWKQVLAPTVSPGPRTPRRLEHRTLTLPAAVTATQFRVVIRGANLSWGHVALYEALCAEPAGDAAPTPPERVRGAASPPIGG